MDHVCSGHPDCKICENERLRARVAELEEKLDSWDATIALLIFQYGKHMDQKTLNDLSKLHASAKALAEVVEAARATSENCPCKKFPSSNPTFRTCSLCAALAKLDAAKGGE